MNKYKLISFFFTIVFSFVSLLPSSVRAEGDWEITPESEEALEKGLAWLAANQGEQGNWGTNEIGVVSMCALAFMADGHLPGRGKYGKNVEDALNFVISNAQEKSGLLNKKGNSSQHDMYNHGLATFVLAQAYGMYSDEKIGLTLDRALKLISAMQCDDGGWRYRAEKADRGNDLSLCVMQAKALRSAIDSGLEIPPEVTQLAIKRVRGYYHPSKGSKNQPESELKKVPGQFTYQGSANGTTAMAAAGVVCLQEFGEYEDWRIEKSMDVVAQAIEKASAKKGSGQLPFTRHKAYTLYYVSQALYQVGGDYWKDGYPKLRDMLVESQYRKDQNPRYEGRWSGGQSEAYSTAVACFVLAIPNRYLPILQEGKIEGIKERVKQ